MGLPLGAVVIGGLGGALLGHSSGILVHNAISPAGAEADEGLVILVLVINLVSMVLAGITAGIIHVPLAIPDAIDLKEVIAPGHILGGILNSNWIGGHVTLLSFSYP